MNLALIVLAAVLAVLVGVILALLLLVLRKMRWQSEEALSADGLASALAYRSTEEQMRRYLCGLIGVEPDQLPPTGDWAATPDILLHIAEWILEHHPRRVVEFGSGVSSVVIRAALRKVGYGTLHSFDHDAEFARVTRARLRRLALPDEVNVVPLAPVDGHPGKWYQVPEVEGAIDLILIDGPPMSLDPQTRSGAATLFPHLSPGGAIFLDDAARPGERAIAERWRAMFPDITFVQWGGAKGTLFGRKAGELPSD